VFDDHLRDVALVQLPVVPLIDPRRRLISGHYADEFAESHRRDLVVRSALEAAIPLAGVACAIRRDALDRLDDGSGTPFEPQSLTEDYELLRARDKTSYFDPAIILSVCN
jgi:adsorption protein B